MKHVFQFLFFTTASMLLLACSDDESRHVKRPLLSISNAESLVVYSNNTAGRIASGSSEDNLYKITLDGTVEKVKFVTDENSDVDPDITSTMIRTDKLYNVNEDYLILDGYFRAWDTLGNMVGYSTLLARKNDGAIYNFGESPYIYSNKFDPKIFHEDGNGNFYFMNGQQVIQINTSDPNNISRTSYLSSGQTTDYFSIDRDGNCMYRMYSQQSGYVIRVRKKSGGIYDSGMDKVYAFWSSTRGQLYYTSYDWTEYVATIHALNFDANGEAIDTIVWRSEPEMDNISNLNTLYYFMIRKPKSVVFIGAQSFEFFEDDNRVVVFDTPPSGNLSIYSDDYLYSSNGTNLYRMSLTDYSYENILPAGYEIYTLNVDANDVVQFSGLRFSDGKKIIAEIHPQNGLRVIEEEKDLDVLYLQRLN